ncbi:MAG: hypothetical protein ACPG19_04215, partial [Saprospiraceae bacterium]
ILAFPSVNRQQSVRQPSAKRPSTVSEASVNRPPKKNLLITEKASFSNYLLIYSYLFELYCNISALTRL